MIDAKPLSGRLLAQAIRHLAGLVFAALWLIAAPAQAQTFSNTTTTPIVDSPTCASVVTRTFTLSNSGNISDIDVGIILSHTYRQDLRISLAHNNGINTVTVNLMTNVTDGSDDLNVRFDDAAAASITTHTGTADNVAATPFQRTFQPQSPLSAFNGRSIAGTWTMTLCDSANVDTGTFRRIDLIITAAPAGTLVDLAVTKTDGTGTVASGASTTYTVVVTNNGPVAVTGAILADPVASGLVKSAVACAASPGQCTAGTTPTIAQLETGYALPTLASGQSYRLTIAATATSAGGTVVNTATITPPSGFTDSATGNNAASDTNSVTTRVAGTPPTITCPPGSVLRTFNWSATNWTNGTTSQAVAIPNVGSADISFALSGGSWVTDPNTGQPSPNATNFSSYGLATNPWVIRSGADYTNNTQFVTATYALPTAIPALQFQLFDIDYQAAGWADRVQVNASFNGSPVPVTLTAGLSNYAIGNVFYGDGASASTESRGNVTVTISQPVDTIVMQYGNHNNLGVIADPVAQFIGWGGFSRICDPVATISVTKISSVLTNPNDIKTNLYRIPGATILYCITATNNGSGTTTNVMVTDAIPATVTYIANSLRTGASCGAATTVEDENNTDADESDPFGMAISGTTVTGRATTLAPGAAVAYTFQATIN